MRLIPLTNRHGTFYVNPLRVQTIRQRERDNGTDISFGEWSDGAEQYEGAKESVEIVADLWRMAMGGQS